jgi:hypothetical protein
MCGVPSRVNLCTCSADGVGLLNKHPMLVSVRCSRFNVKIRCLYVKRVSNLVSRTWKAVRLCFIADMYCVELRIYVAQMPAHGHGFVAHIRSECGVLFAGVWM